MAKEIKFNIKLSVDGKERLVTATTSTKDLQKSLQGAKGAAERLRTAFDDFNRIGFAAQNIAESFNKLTKSTNEYLRTQNQLSLLSGATGKELSQYRNQITSIADYFGKDFNEVLLAGNNLSKGFGVSMGEALNLIQSGMVSGADANGEFLDTLREYPRYFKEAGLSAEDFIAIATSAAQQGVYSDKGVDVIKEGNLRIREMTKATAEALDAIGISSDTVQEKLQNGSLTTFQVMQQVAQKLKELPASSSAVGTAIADIFGGPGEDAGLEYIKSLADVQLSMGAVKAAAGDMARQQDEIINRNADLKNGLTDLVDISAIIEKVQPFINYTAQIGLAVIATTSAVSALNNLKIASFASAVAVKSLAAANTVCRAAMISLNAIVAASAGHFKASAVGATTLKVAIRGLLVASGVGIAITALGVALDYLMSSSDDAADNVDALKDAQDTFTNSAASVQVELDKETKKLGELTWNVKSSEAQRLAS